MYWSETWQWLQEEAQNNVQRVPLIIVNGIKSLKQNSVIIDRDYWLKVTCPWSNATPYGNPISKILACCEVAHELRKLCF